MNLAEGIEKEEEQARIASHRIESPPCCVHIASHLIVSFFPSDLDEDARVQSLGEVALGLAHELAREQNVGGGAVAGHILLRGSSAGNDGSGRVLDLLKQRAKRKATRVE